MFRTVPLSIIRSFIFTVHTAMAYVIQVMRIACEQDQYGTSSLPILLASCQQNMYDIYLLLCVQWKTPDDGQRNCLKHVEIYSENKLEKLVHLVGFILRTNIQIGKLEAKTIIWWNCAYECIVIFKVHLKVVGWKNLDCIHLIQDRVLSYIFVDVFVYRL